ncbi:MAG: 4-hydroxybenzoate octaprenyltransferase, partial [Pseudomonadota bacterium]
SLSLAPLLLYAAGFVWTLFYDTIYAHQDKEDDALIGVKSTARLFAANTGRWLAGFMMAAVLLLSGAVVVALGGDANPLPLLIGLAGAWGFGWHMLWQMRRLDIDDPAICMVVFRSNRDAGLIPALFLAVAALV